MKYVKSLMIILVLVLSCSFTSSSGKQDLQIDIDSKEPEITDNLINAIKSNTKRVDVNNDKIADYLLGRQGIVDSIILFENFNSRDLFARENNVENIFDQIPAVSTFINMENIDSIRSSSGLVLIEENLEIKTQLAYSTNQIDVREGVWDLGYTGSPDYSVAIIDSGIDFTHSAFEGRIIASYNAINNNATSAIDYIGHGTHVAGIVAGLFSNNTTTQTARYTLPPDGSFYYEISIPNVQASTTIDIGLDWGEEGQDFPGSSAGVLLVKTNELTKIGCTGCFETSGTGKLETTFTIESAGDYFLGVYNDEGGENQPYEVWVEIKDDISLPTFQNPDNHPKYAGMAYGTNIVAVKAIDSTDGGSTADILKAIDWVIENKETYNIVVVNLSVGSQSAIIASMDTAIAALAFNGIIPVSSAGNLGPASNGVFSPASAPEGIAVGAVNRVNEIAYYSSRGSEEINGVNMKPDLLAPGGSFSFPGASFLTSYEEGLGTIISADSNYVTTNTIQNDLTGNQGTSMAAPHIAGLAALLVDVFTRDNPWSWSENDVIRIKQAILAGTFEVANIGLDGGEQQVGQADPHPNIDRSSKDWFEGWGAVSAKAAINNLQKQSFIGTRTVNFELSNPFGEKVSTSTLFAKAGVGYEFTADVPNGADVDLLVFDTTASVNGDLVLLQSSLTSSKVDASNDEVLVISTASDKELMLVARLVDSDNQEDNITISVIDPQFSPHIEISNLINDSYISDTEFGVEFTSVINKAEFYLDDVSLGVFSSGYVMKNLEQGVHNLTLVETNLFTNEFDTSSVIFTVDLVNPIFESIDLPNSIDSSYLLAINATDNYALELIQVFVDGLEIKELTLDGNTSIINIEIDPYFLKIGSYEVLVKLLDAAGNFVQTSKIVNFDHDTFIVPNGLFLLEYGGQFELAWDAGVSGVNPIDYEISLDGVNLINTMWDGSGIHYLLPTLDLGQYSLQISVRSTSRSITINESVVIQDSTKPIIHSSIGSGVYNSDEEMNIQFTSEELLPQELYVFVNGEATLSEMNWDGDSEDIKFTVSGKHEETTTIEVKIIDTSNNTGSGSVNISWLDLTDPKFILEPENQEIITNEAVTPLIWQWEESNAILAQLTRNSVEVTSIEFPTGNTYEYGVDDLVLLSEGRHTFRFTITDVNNKEVTSTVIVTVNKSSSSSSIPFNFAASVIAILFGIFTNQVNRSLKSREFY